VKPVKAAQPATTYRPRKSWERAVPAPVARAERRWFGLW
jgi:hypothetical protein